MQLSAQSIRDLCLDQDRPMISPFSDERNVVNGKSWGLSSASYDVRIAHDLVLGAHPGFLIERGLMTLIGLSYADQCDLVDEIRKAPPSYALACTMEDFILPDNVSGFVCDKSSYARVFVSAMNTYFDPGFAGNATLELVNLGPEIVTIKAGDPICQLVFHWLDVPTDRPYHGKYQNQAKGPQAARYEE